MRDFLAGFSKTLSCPITPPLSQRGGWGDWKAGVNPPLIPLFQRGKIRLSALSLKSCPPFTFYVFTQGRPRINAETSSAQGPGQGLLLRFYVGQTPYQVRGRLFRS